MKQLPHVAGLLYGTPWAIRPAVHTELGLLYHRYVTGTLPVPVALGPEGQLECGISYQADHASGLGRRG